MQCQTLSFTSSTFFLITPRPALWAKKGGGGVKLFGKGKNARHRKFLSHLIFLPSLCHALPSEREPPCELPVNRQRRNGDVDYVDSPANCCQRPDAPSKQLHVRSTGLKIKFSKWVATERFGPSTSRIFSSGFFGFLFLGELILTMPAATLPWR